MVELVKEVLNRKWNCTIEDGVIYIILGNIEYIVTNDTEAQDVLDEIKKYW